MDPGWREKLTDAHAQLLVLHEQYPDFADLHSCVIQLQYLLDLDRGVITDDSRLENIVLGLYAVKHLSGTISDELCESLCEIDAQIEGELRRQGRHKKY